MTKHIFSFALLLGALLAACAPAVDHETGLSEPTGVPPTTVVTAVAMAEPTAVPTATTPAAETELPSMALDDFVAQLKTAVSGQDFGAMRELMGDPFRAGPWRSEWQTFNVQQALGQFQSGALPYPLAVQFSELGMDEIAQLLGQPPETLLPPDVGVAAVLHSSGWGGQSENDDAILFVSEQDGRYVWSALLYTNGRFADASLGTAAAPVGLIYSVSEDGIYQIQADGSPRQLFDVATAVTPNLRVAPDGRHAAYLDDARRLWLVDSAGGEAQQIAPDVNFSYFMLWGDERTLLAGVWLTPEEGEGPNNGHIATIDIETGALQILDEAHISAFRPALAPDGRTVAFDAVPASPNERIVSYLHHPDSGLTVFDPAAFAMATPMIGEFLYNPSWSPDGRRITWLSSSGERVGLQVYDLDAATAVQVFDWDPARFGALIPSPVWSPDGSWLALEVWANGPQGSGVWLIAADGSSQTLVDALGHDPFWIGSQQLAFNVSGSPRIYDIGSGQAFKLQLPDGSWILNSAPASEMTELPAGTPSAEVGLPDPTTLALEETTSVAPDGRWQATIAQSEPVVVDSGEQFYTSLTVTDGVTTWTPLAEWRPYGLGYLFPAVLQWSADGRYLYYANQFSADGCGLFPGTNELLRLDLDTGASEVILPAGLTTSVALSPDAGQVAYAGFDGRDVVVTVRDLATAEEQSVTIAGPVASAQAGSFLWSPDGTFFLLTVAQEPCSADWAHAIVRVDVAAGALTAVTLVDADARLFTTQGWADVAGAEARLRDKDGGFWILDAASGGLAPE